MYYGQLILLDREISGTSTIDATRYYEVQSDERLRSDNKLLMF